MPVFERACSLGYTLAEVEHLIGSEQLPVFNQWFDGKTGVICDGRRYSHETKEYEETGCGPHGMIVYSHDLTRFIHSKWNKKIFK